MNLNFKENIPADFNDSSRVWIYQSNRVFDQDEIKEVKNLFADFVAAWNSHGAKVKGFATLLFGRFIILMADETATGVSGCSTDSSVRLIKSIEEKMTVQLFDRQSLAFVIEDKIELIQLSELDHAIENNIVTADTFYFNNIVLSKNELLERWIVPVSESWLGKRMAAKI